MNARAETFYMLAGDFEQDTSSVRQAVKQKDSSVVSINKGSKPKWLASTTKRLFAILALNNNWDSYGAKRISDRVAGATDDLLWRVMQKNTPAPQIVPSANGSIQLEWHLRGIDLEVEVESYALSRVFFEDAQNEELPWEGDIDVDLTKLVHFINLLTNRVQLSTN